MKFNKLTFGDIMQPNMLFYDENEKEACKNICETLHINNLPAINGKNYYELENKDEKFIRKKILKKHRLDVDERIFDKKMIKMFENNKYNVLFVFDGNVLMGIVHLSDYNDDIVIQTIQDDFLKFERNLRHWYELNGLNNQDMVDFFQYKSSKAKKDSKNKEFWETRVNMTVSRKTEMGILGEFQLFDFNDLLLFGCSKKYKRIFKIEKSMINGDEIDGVKVLTDLRNLAMHGKNPIEFNKQETIYSIDSLVSICDKLSFFKAQYLILLEQIRNHSDYIKSIEMDNRSKLRIINEHHPKALDYFLNKK